MNRYSVPIQYKECISDLVRPAALREFREDVAVIQKQPYEFPMKKALVLGMALTLVLTGSLFADEKPVRNTQTLEYRLK